MAAADRTRSRKLALIARRIRRGGETGDDVASGVHALSVHCVVRQRVLRGGGFNLLPVGLCSAYRYGFRPSKIASIIAEMIASPQMMRRRLREGVEFFQFLRARRGHA